MGSLNGIEVRPTAGAALVSETAAAIEGRWALAAIEELGRWADLAEGAYSQNTQRAWRADWRVFCAYCQLVDASPLPATPETVRLFLLACHPLEDPEEEGAPRPLRRAPATLRRYLATITRIHRAAKLEDPCRSEPVTLAMRAIARKAGTRQRQAPPFGWRDLKDFFALEPVSLRDLRDRALVALAYDVLGRTNEIAEVDVEDLERDGQGNATLLIPRSKVDVLGEGEHAFVAAQTMEWIQAWLAAAGIKKGAVFRVVHGHHEIGERLKPAGIAATLRRAARKAGLGKLALTISGHSAPWARAKTWQVSASTHSRSCRPAAGRTAVCRRDTPRGSMRGEEAWRSLQRGRAASGLLLLNRHLTATRHMRTQPWRARRRCHS